MTILVSSLAGPPDIMIVPLTSHAESLPVNMYFDLPAAKPRPRCPFFCTPKRFSLPHFVRAESTSECLLAHFFCSTQFPLLMVSPSRFPDFLGSRDSFTSKLSGPGAIRSPLDPSPTLRILMEAGFFLTPGRGRSLLPTAEVAFFLIISTLFLGHVGRSGSMPCIVGHRLATPLTLGCRVPTPHADDGAVYRCDTTLFSLFARFTSFVFANGSASGQLPRYVP